MRKLVNRISDGVMLLRLSLRLQLGRWFWVVPVAAILWPACLAVALLAGWLPTDFDPVFAQNGIIGIPLYILAIGLGVRIIAGEIEQRTLEVTYTVPGGAQRVWVSKIFAALVPLLVAEALLAVIAEAFFTDVPLSALYGALQGAVFYLVLAMGLGALARSEMTAALVASVVLFMNGLMTGFGDISPRISPLFNSLNTREDNDALVLAWTIQNRIGFALLILALVALAAVRAERREQLLRA
jgi:hypothetical protein